MPAKRSEVATHSTVLTKFQSSELVEKVDQPNQPNTVFNCLVEDEQTQPTKQGTKVLLRDLPEDR